MRAILVMGLWMACFASGWSAAAAPLHDVISEDESGGRRVISVRLKERLVEADLLQVAGTIKGTSKEPAAPMLVAFYLTGMPLDQGAWASVSFAPDAKAKINGLKREEQEQFEATLAVDRRQLVGAWITDMPAAPGRLVIFRDKGKPFAEWLLRSGRKSVEELIEVRGSRGSRFDPRAGSADYYLLKANGSLELRNKQRLIAIAERMEIPKPDLVAGKIALPAEVARLAATSAPSTAADSANPAPSPNALAGDATALDLETAKMKSAAKPKSARRPAKPDRMAADAFGFRTIFQGTR